MPVPITSRDCRHCRCLAADRPSVRRSGGRSVGCRVLGRAVRPSAHTASTAPRHRQSITRRVASFRAFTRPPPPPQSVPQRRINSPPSAASASSPGKTRIVRRSAHPRCTMECAESASIQAVCTLRRCVNARWTNMDYRKSGTHKNSPDLCIL